MGRYIPFDPSHGLKDRRKPWDNHGSRVLEFEVGYEREHDYFEFK